MSRSRRYWPKPLQDDLFIKRPHAVEQFMSRAGYPKGYSFDLAEEELREKIVKAMQDGDLLANDKTGEPNEFVIKVQVPDRKTVYALVERGRKDGEYQFLIHTVFSKEMYDEWRRDGKVGTIADLPQAAALKELEEHVTQTEEEKEPEFLVQYKNGAGKMLQTEVTEDKLETAIIGLLMQGATLPDIKVYKRHEINLKLG
jgi:hypothetical protein